MSYFPEGHNRHIVTILSVDLEEGGPVWHFSMASRNTTGIVLGDQGSMMLLQDWDFDPEDKYFDYALGECLPRRYDADRDYVDKLTCSVHVRSKLTDAERKYVCTPEEGGRTQADYEAEIMDVLRDERQKGTLH